MTKAPYEISMFVPGGILPTDHIHRKTNDDTCSRCRQVVDEGEVPIIFWVGKDAEDMLIYCRACTDAPKPEAGK